MRFLGVTGTSEGSRDDGSSGDVLGGLRGCDLEPPILPILRDVLCEDGLVANGVELVRNDPDRFIFLGEGSGEGSMVCLDGLELGDLGLAACIDGRSNGEVAGAAVASSSVVVSADRIGLDEPTLPSFLKGKGLGV